MGIGHAYFGIAVIAGVALSSCDFPSEATRVPTVLDRIVQKYLCSPGTAEPKFFPGDSLTVAERCALVGAARDAIGPDTGLIADALVLRMTWEDSNGTVLQSYWSVSFSIPSHRWDDEVHIDRTTGAISAGHIHKPF